MKHYFFLLICITFAFLNFNCSNDELELEVEVPDPISIYAQKIGTHEMDLISKGTEIAKTFLFEEKVCIISSTEISVLPFDTTKEAFHLRDVDIEKVVVNEFDTIILMNNILHRFFPSESRLEQLYLPGIKDFCLTPNRGIGYFTYASSIVGDVFQYYDIETRRTETIFNTSAYPDEKIEHLHTYLSNDSLFFMMITSSIYGVEVTHTYHIPFDNPDDYKRINPGKINFFKIHDNEEIIASYIRNRYNVLGTYNFLNGQQNNLFIINIPANLKDLSFHGDYHAQFFEANSYHVRVRLYNWRTNTLIFDVTRGSEGTIFLTSKLYNYEEQHVISYHNYRNTLRFFDQNGLEKYKLHSNGEGIQSVLASNEDCVILITTDQDVEIVYLQ